MMMRPLSTFEALQKYFPGAVFIDLSDAARLLSERRSQVRAPTDRIVLPFAITIIGFKVDGLVDAVGLGVYWETLKRNPEEFAFVLLRLDSGGPIFAIPFICFQEDPGAVGEIEMPMQMTCAADIKPATAVPDQLIFDLMVGVAFEPVLGLLAMLNSDVFCLEEVLTGAAPDRCMVLRKKNPGWNPGKNSAVGC